MDSNGSTRTQRNVDQIWRRAIARRLEDLSASGAERSRIEHELAQMMVDEAEAAGVNCDRSEDVEHWIAGQAERLTELAQELAKAAGRLEGPVLGAPPEVPERPERGRSSGGRRAVLSGLRGDVVAAVRAWRRRPGLALVVFATLILGIGLNASIFSILHSVLFRSAAVAEPQDLIKLYASEPNGFLPEEPMAYLDLEDLESAESLEGVAAQAMTFVALSGESRAEMVIAEMVTDDLFDVVGVEPVIGRLIDPQGIRAGETEVAVLSENAWIRRFAKDPEIVGRTIRVNGHPLEVIGVIPAEYIGVVRGIGAELWIPLETGLRIGAGPSTNSGSGDLLESRNRRGLWGVARKNSSVTHEQAAAEIASIAAGLAAEYPETNEGREFKAVPYQKVTILPAIDGNVNTVSRLILVVVFVVLLIASANLANLLIARALARRGEMATRLSLGASRGRIVRQLLVESFLLSGVGAAGGLALAWLVSRAVSLVRLEMIVPVQADVRLAWPVVGFTVALAAVTALLFGLAPALEASRTDLASVMKDQSGRGGSRKLRLQTALVVGQVTFSVLLLIFAGLLVRSVRQASTVDIGIELDGVAGVSLSPRSQGYEDDDVASFYRRLREDLEARPEIEAVSMPTHVPLTIVINTDSMVPVERAGEDPDEWPDVDTASVDHRYFDVLGITRLRGRVFEQADLDAEERTTVVNEVLAEQFWPGEDPIGQLIATSPESDPARVIGVVANGKYRSFGDRDRPFAYSPISESTGMRAVVARFRDPSRAQAETVVEAIRRIDSDLAVTNPGTLEQMVGPTLLIPKAAALVFGTFGAIGLLLSAIGLFGILAYSVSQRRREIGLRIAVGASARDIVGLVARRGLWMTGLGALFGVGLALVTTRFLTSLLYGVSATDLGVFFGAPGILLVTALLATLAPARRALRVSPTESLRLD